MHLSRRDWLRFTGGAALAASLPRSVHAAPAAVDFPRDVVPFTREFEPGRRVVGDELKIELQIEAKPQQPT